jgi:hypothetical protein
VIGDFEIVEMDGYRKIFIFKACICASYTRLIIVILVEGFSHDNPSVSVYDIDYRSGLVSKLHKWIAKDSKCLA